MAAYIERLEGVPYNSRNALWSDVSARPDWSVWLDLKAWVNLQARSAPKKDNGYDKCRFIILYVDGSLYYGRFDLQYEHLYEMNPVGNHIHRLQTYLAEHDPEWRVPAKHFLENYDVGQRN